MYGEKNTKLAPGPRPNQLLAFNSRVLNQSCDFYIVISAETSLVISTEPPAVSASLAINCETVI